jgi:hypothetical protein
MIITVFERESHDLSILHQRGTESEFVEFIRAKAEIRLLDVIRDEMSACQETQNESYQGKI